MRKLPLDPFLIHTQQKELVLGERRSFVQLFTHSFIWQIVTSPRCWVQREHVSKVGGSTFRSLSLERTEDESTDNPRTVL